MFRLCVYMYVLVCKQEMLACAAYLSPCLQTTICLQHYTIHTTLNTHTHTLYIHIHNAVSRLVYIYTCTMGCNFCLGIDLGHNTIIIRTGIV